MTQQIEKTEQVQKKPRKTKRGLYVSFELGYNHIAIFRELLKTIDDAFTSELPIQIDQDSLTIRVMDPSRVQMANYVISKTAFEEWHVSNHTTHKTVQLPVSFTVPLKEVSYAIEEAGKDAKAQFVVKAVFATVGVKTTVTKRKPEKCPKCGSATNINQLPKEKRGKKGNRYKCLCGWRGKVRTWTKKAKEYETDIEEKESEFLITVQEKTVENWNVKFLDVVAPETPMPILRPDARFKLVGPDFRAKIERLRKRTDAVKLVGSQDKLVLKGESDYISGAIELKKGSDIVLDIDCRNEEKATFSINNLFAILPKKSVADIISLEFSTDKPLKVVAFTDLGDSKIEYYLAPRLEVE